jgi:hypothetical protein
MEIKEFGLLGDMSDVAGIALEPLGAGRKYPLYNIKKGKKSSERKVHDGVGEGRPGMLAEVA